MALLGSCLLLFALAGCGGGGVLSGAAGLGGALSFESFVEWRYDASHAGKELLVEAGVRLRMAL